MPLGSVVMDISGGNNPEPHTTREASKCLVTGRISLDTVVLQFGKDISRPEGLHELLHQRFRFGHGGFECGRDRTFPTSSE